MFLDNLTQPERVALLGLLTRVADADGRRDPTEHASLHAARRAIGAPDAPPADSVDALAQRFTSRKSKISALLELLAMVHIDGVAHPAEHSLVAHVARVMGVPSVDVEGLSSWAVRQVMLLQEAHDFWAEEA